MGTPHSEDRRQTVLETVVEDARQEIMRQVLEATNAGLRAESQDLNHRYRPVVQRWQDSPWHPETIGKSLVETALESWYATLNTTESARNQLSLDIARAIFEDPFASARLEAWWNQLRKSQS